MMVAQGLGQPHATAENLAILVAMLHDESSGRIDVASSGRPKIRYALDDGDTRALRRGIVACAQLLRAAGAREILAPFADPIVLRDDEDTFRRDVMARPIRPLDPQLTAVHPMSSLPMARDPARGVTDGDGRFHTVPGLYVADGSLFPTSIGGPPQISIYTAGRRVARTVLADLGRSPTGSTPAASPDAGR